MTPTESPKDEHSSGTFAQAAQGAAPSLLQESWDLLRYNKKWWLLPILLILLAAGLFILLSGTVFAPFIYPLF